VSEDIAYTNRFVADRGTGRAVARAFVRHALTMRSQVVFLSAFFVFCLLVWTVTFDEAPLGAALFWAVVLSVVPTLSLLALISAIGYVRTLRGSRHRLFEGAVVESGFGEDEMVLRGVLGETRLKYRAVRSLEVRGDHVFMQQHGVAVVSIYPRVLFPDDAVRRIRAAGTTEVRTR
jgi:hypothetical protein